MQNRKLFCEQFDDTRGKDNIDDAERALAQIPT
jgi:hypothetical protein